MSSIRPTRSLVVAAAGLAVAAVAGLAGTATAETGTFADSVGDVRHGVDVASVKVVNEKNVRVVVQHDDLVRSFRSNASMTVYLDTDRSEPGPEFAFIAGLFEGTDYALVPTTGAGWAPKRRGMPLSCSHTLRLDYARDVTRIRIARRCLDQPGQVRVAVKAAGQRPGGAIVTDWLEGRRALTPWVAKG